jgi:RNA polymerase sigma-70 factor (ECF subfamily)
VIAVLHLVDGLSLEETARETGMSVSGVRKRLRQLRERAVAEEGMRNA